MKKHLHFILSLAVVLCLAGQSKAQSILIHYWHFNNAPISAVYHNPGIPAIKADYSRIDTNKALFVYNRIPAASSTYAGYEDFVATVSTDYDTLNLRMGATGGTAIRFRNPSDSSYLTFNIPTTHYKNIALKFTIETSNTTASPTNQAFAYSTDSGTTWKTTGLNVTTDTVTPVFSMISVNFGTDTTVNNNPKLIFKITNTVRTTGGGNVRYDNISVDGDTATGSTPPALALIHYWHFNNLVGAWHNTATSTVPAFKADWSAIDTNKTDLAYKLLPGTSNTYGGYVDNLVTGTPDSDVYNNRTIGTTVTPPGNAYRFRNPTDSAYLVFYIPSTGYKNLVFSYAVEASSSTSGYHYNNFQYSTDSGATWKTTGLDHVYDSALSVDSTPQFIFKPIVVKFTAADTTVNNNPKLCFKITPSFNTHGTSGNNRFDNFTLDGVPLPGVYVPQTTAPVIANCNLYPNPADHSIYITMPENITKVVMIYNAMGQRVYNTLTNDRMVKIDISSFNTGIYFANIRMENGKMQTIRFIKN